MSAGQGSGLYLGPNETNPIKIANTVRQLIEGRGNFVGLVTLTNDSVATTTTVAAPTCGPNSIVILFPSTSAASTFFRGSEVRVRTADITKGQFVVTHAATGTAGLTFFWLCVG